MTMESKCPRCYGLGEICINLGMCGGCEVCGNDEEKIVPCPACPSHPTPAES